MSESKFSKQNVVQAYQQMTQSSDPDLIKQADTYLNDFLVSFQNLAQGE